MYYTFKTFSHQCLTHLIQRLGGIEKLNEEKALQAAVDLASSSDVVVVVGGLTSEWESEGFDRKSLQLPGRKDELIGRVSAANKNTVVILQGVSSRIIICGIDN